MIQRVIAHGWSAPAVGAVAFGLVWSARTLLEDPGYESSEWPRRMTVIERPVAYADAPAFLDHLCVAARERGYGCRRGRAEGGVLQAEQAELWKGEVHVTALAAAGVQAVRIEMFDDIDAPANAEAEWLRAI